MLEDAVVVFGGSLHIWQKDFMKFPWTIIHHLQMALETSGKKQGPRLLYIQSFLSVKAMD